MVMHPICLSNQANWEKFRLSYHGGTEFINKYLKKMSTRETQEDFNTRLETSYCPAFAKAAINDIKNAIFQRIADVRRLGGSSTYQDAILGRRGGVDLTGQTMDSFVGADLLPELLPMGRVGVYVDMPEILGPTVSDTVGKTPYIYLYRTEAIRSWSYNESKVLQTLLLEDLQYDCDDITGLVSTSSKRYRYYKKEADHISVRIYDSVGKIDPKVEPDYRLNLKQIPFVMFELPTALMQDVADYQIALLNIESSDIAYILKSNYPFYTEQYDKRLDASHLKPTDGESDETITTGSATGRKYGKDLDRPGFIHPSSEPLTVSMQKAQQLKKDIKHLVNLGVSDYSTAMSSAESKGYDSQSLEAGLSFIGLILARGENKIADIWADYEKNSPAEIHYPASYSLKTDANRQEEADKLSKMSNKVNSSTYRKEISKQIARTLFNGKVADDTLIEILKEIDNSRTTNADPKTITSDLKDGLVSPELASDARGYPKGEVAKAKAAHEEKLRLIAISQAPGMGAARGINETQADQPSSAEEKEERPSRAEGALNE